MRPSSAYERDKALAGFNEYLLVIINAALGQLGVGLMESIYAYLEKRGGVKPADIPKDPAQVDQILHTILGPDVSLVIERLIAKRLAADLDLPQEKLEYAHLPEIVARCRARYDELGLVYDELGLHRPSEE